MNSIMKLNKKGFTLIESIITFAILAIAGGMFILGFYNVSVIASEGSIIKTETNNLYNSVVSGETGDIQPPYSLTFTFDDNTTSAFKCWAIEEESKLGDESNEIVIRLFRYVPAISLDEWAEPETSDNEMIDATIRFHLRWPMSGNKSDFPYNKKNYKGQEVAIDLNNNSQGGVAYSFYTDQKESIKIKKNTTTSLYNEQYILNSINKVPTVEEISKTESIIPQDPGNEIIWYQIQKQNDGSYDIIGFKVPSQITVPNLVIIIDADGYFKFTSEGTAWSDSSLNFMGGKQAKSIRDGKLYNGEEIYKNREKYPINIYTIEK